MGTINKMVLLFLLSTIVWSCKEEKNQDPSVAMMKEVMAVHDELMPEMSTISRLVGELRPKVDSTDQGMVYEKAMKNLQEANAQMMDWMQDFTNRFDSDETMNGKELTPEKKAWLKEEKQKIEALKQRFEVSISEAEAILKE